MVDYTVALTVVIALGIAGCGQSKSAAGAPPDERQRDSVIGASQLPGAQGVRGALRVGDSADARRAREDSAGR